MSSPEIVKHRETTILLAKATVGAFAGVLVLKGLSVTPQMDTFIPQLEAASNFVLGSSLVLAATTALHLVARDMADRGSNIPGR